MSSLTLILALAHVGMVAGKPAAVDGKRISAARKEPQNWLVAGGDYREQRFSPLRQINELTVGKLGLAWSYDIPTSLGQEATPIVVDGVMYVSTDGSVVDAFDAKTGELLWTFDPQALFAMVSSCCGPNNRGVAVWHGRVYVGTLDGRLIALNATTGKEIWSTLTVDPQKPYTISGVPRIVHGKVIIGNGGAELGVRGYVTAYDADTGRQIWRFYTVPGNPAIRDQAASDDVIEEKARKTWTGEYWRFGGGGTVWDSMAYDPQLNLLYIGVGNGGPWNEAIRSPGGGDNLFISSIVALNPDTGKYVWHYQTTPGDSWDFTATQSIILADMEIGGKSRHVLMQAPKNGFFYVLDRKTGKLLSADAYAPVTWATGISPETGRPIESPGARYFQTNKPTLLQPGSAGAHNWQSMAFSPATGLAYIPAQNIPLVFQSNPDEIFGTKKTNVGVTVDGATPLTSDTVRAVQASFKGWLAAWDPAQRREVWRVPQKHFWNGGVLVTAGNLVFQGNGNGEFSAYRATDGRQEWGFDSQTGIIAAPMSYAIDGQQYIAIMAGWGGIMPLLGGGLSNVTGRENGPNRLLVFTLGGTATLHDVSRHAAPRATAVTEAISGPSVEHGATLYGRYCFTCHGVGAVSGGVTPDLRFSPFIADKGSFASVVVQGALASRGMASFRAEIGDEAGAEDIRAYLIKRSTE